MMLRKNCLAAALTAAAAAFVSASAQTVFEGSVQPAVPASQPVVHAIPPPPPASAPQPAQKPAEKPAAKPTQKPTEKPAHKSVHRPVHGPTHKAAPQAAMRPAPSMLPAPASQPAEQPVPTSQPYAQPAPTPQPYAQPAPQPDAQPAVQPVVNWTLQVIRDGQQVDSFDGTTTVGQARINKHHKVVTHKVGCKEQPAGSIDLERTITVSPLRADSTGSVLAIEAQETLESDTTPKTREGCKLPPQPSQVHASHPGLVVPAGQWVTWQIVGQDPSLLYRVRASLAPPSTQP